MYILDTNTLSEIRKRKPNQGVVNFFKKVKNQNARLYISVVTVGEILAGVKKLRLDNDHRQADVIQAWYHKIMINFENKTLDFDQECAEIWSDLIARNHQNGVDKQIGATALMYDLTLVTRNVKHFDGTGVKILNPFV